MEQGAAVSVDPSDDSVYLSGYTNGSLAEANGGGNDAFVVRFDDSGNIEWARQVGSVTAALLGGDALANQFVFGSVLQSDGTIVLAGSTAGATVETNAGGQDAFFVAFDAAGTVKWGTQLGSVTSAALGNDATQMDIVRHVTRSTSDAIIAATYTSSSLGETNGAPGLGDVAIIQLKPTGVLDTL
jgi:hypothetical protein